MPFTINCEVILNLPSFLQVPGVSWRIFWYAPQSISGSYMSHDSSVVSGRWWQVVLWAVMGPHSVSVYWVGLYANCIHSFSPSIIVPNLVISPLQSLDYIGSKSSWQSWISPLNTSVRSLRWKLPFSYFSVLYTSSGAVAVKLSKSTFTALKLDWFPGSFHLRLYFNYASLITVSLLLQTSVKYITAINYYYC